MERRARTVPGERERRTFGGKADQSTGLWTCILIRFLRSYVTEPSSAVTRGSLFFLKVQMSIGSKVTSIDRHSPSRAIVSLLLIGRHLGFPLAPEYTCTNTKFTGIFISTRSRQLDEIERMETRKNTPPKK